MVDCSHRVITLVEASIAGNSLCNYHLAWKLENPESAEQIKYYRVFRSKDKNIKEKTFLGITTSMFYVDKRVDFNYTLYYIVEAVGHSQIILDKIVHSLQE